jgi:hypothetical protein
MFARVLSSRPLKEQVIRNQNFRHTLYDQADQRRRKNMTMALRTQVRTGTAPDSILANYLQEGGSPAGWRQALNTAQLTADGTDAELLQRAIAKQPGIGAIMQGYNF